MHTDIRQIDSTRHLLEISATAGDLVDDVRRAVKEIKSKAVVKGFRPGRVPPNLIRIVYRSELKETVSEKFIEEVYNDFVKDSGEYAVFGAHEVSKLDYEVDGALTAEVTFFVLPQIDLEALGQEEVTQLTYSLTDADVDEMVDSRMAAYVTWMPLDDGEELSEGHAIMCGIRELDKATHTAIGEGDATERTLMLNTDTHKDDVALVKAAIGSRVGDTVTFEVETDAETEPVETQLFSAIIHEAANPEIPKLDEEFFQRESIKGVGSVEELRADTRREAQLRVDRRLKRVNSNLVRKRMLELYPFAVPEASVDMIARESYLVNKDDIKRKLRWGMIIRAIQSQHLDASGDTADHSENGDMDKHEEQVLAFLKKIFTLQTEELDDPPSMLYYDYPY